MKQRVTPTFFEKNNTRVINNKQLMAVMMHLIIIDYKIQNIDT